MEMMPVPDPIVEDSALVMIFYKDKDGKKRSYHTCLSTADAEEIENLAKDKSRELGLKLADLAKRDPRNFPEKA